MKKTWTLTSLVPLKAFYFLWMLLGGFFLNGGRALGEPIFPACDPESPFYSEIVDPFAEMVKNSSSQARGESVTAGLDVDFCVQWNPDFRYNGNRCCSTVLLKRKRRQGRCAPERRGGFAYCKDVTDEQLWYRDQVSSGKIKDVLAFLGQELGRNSPQAFCSVNNGFLVRGKPVIPSEINRIALRSPERCNEYGTDSMVAMLEWLGRRVGEAYSGPEYKNVKLVLGDISSPKGGCNGHASHRAGLDVDISFLWAKPNKSSPVQFHRTFELKDNWWLIKEIFKNPYACVRVVFLDRKLISKLARKFGGEPEWPQYARFIRHMPRHKDHWHVRVGEYPGQPGCTAISKPELEEDDYGFEEESDSENETESE